MEAWATPLISFLAGTLVGAAGGYYATKFTDQRHRKEAKVESAKLFKATRALMPELFDEMKQDLERPDDLTVREFAVLPTATVKFRSSQKRFYYFENVHEDLRGKMGILESRGYIIDVTPKDVPIYKMTEDFVEQLRAM